MVKKGRLSATRDSGGNYVIDKAEFYRVFPDAHTKRSHANNDSGSSRIVLKMEVQHLKEMLAEKNKQNEFLHKLYGLYFLGEPANAMRISCMVLIIAAIIGLKLSSH